MVLGPRFRFPSNASFLRAEIILLPAASGTKKLAEPWAVSWKCRLGAAMIFAACFGLDRLLS